MTTTEHVETFTAALAQLTRGQFFGVEFIRRDGALRRMSAKLVRFEIDPDNPRSVRQADVGARSGNVVVLDASLTARTGQRKVRSFSVDRLVCLRICGQTITTRS